MIYGYARVSTRSQAVDGNSLESQQEALIKAGAEQIFSDTYTGTSTDRPELNKLIEAIGDNDTLIVTKLDRIARSARQGLELVDQLNSKNVCVRILNMGTIDNTAIGKLMRTMLFGFAEFERDMIVERTQEGKKIARKNQNYKDGRPEKFKKEQIEHAIELLKDHSYAQVANMTGISVATLVRKKRVRGDAKK